MQNQNIYIKITKSTQYLILTIITFALLVSAFFSLDRGMHYDHAFMHYAAYLINEHGFIPYRDIFDLNMPVSYLIHMAIGKVLGYSDISLRIANLIWLSAMLIVTWFIMKPFGRLVAFTSCILFGLIYIQSPFDFERDMIATLLIGIGICLVIYIKAGLIKYTLIGIVFALAALIKPHLIIGLPILMVFDFVNHFNNERGAIGKYIKNILLTLLSFLLIIISCIFWLWQIGALQSFWEIIVSYIPLYSKITMEQQNGYLNYLFSSYRHFGGYSLLMVSAVLGVYIVLSETTVEKIKNLSVLLLIFSLVYSLYVLISGRFLGYHWALYTYFASLCTALLLFPPDSLKSYRLLLPIMVFAFITFLITAPTIKASITELVLHTPPISNDSYEKEANEIKDYLDKNMTSSDTVQPLEYRGGQLYGMLKAKAVLSTPYIVDFYFYHHISNPYIQQLRQDFLKILNTKKPTFIIQKIQSGKLCDACDEAHPNFIELQNFIEENYTIDHIGKTFLVYKKI